MSKLNTYKCILDFRSLALNKIFKPGDEIKAPASLGTQWVKQKLAIKISTDKSEKP